MVIGESEMILCEYFGTMIGEYFMDEHILIKE